MKPQRSGLGEDLRAIPEDLRSAARHADREIKQAAAERPALAQALDPRLVIVIAALALLAAVVLRAAGLGFLPSLLVFLVLFAGGWLGVSRAAAARRPSR
jgi:Flp pilus assembly protein TadB